MCRNICIFFFIFSSVVADKIVVTVKQGKLLGHREANVLNGRLYFAFYGIPYAKPPIENLRFKNPEPIEPWNNTFDASLQYYGTCAQSHIIHKRRLYGVEDCLYLNIYTPQIPRDADTNLKPVIVWIHGYAFTSCFSHIHGPDFLLDKDVVVVTLTHRIGVFGFLKLDDNSHHENMGLKDIVMALKWIRFNIKQFGGDKKKITLMGNGSGATFISLLMTTTASKLFSQVILQSGAIFSPSMFQGNPKKEKRKLIKELEKKHLKLNNAPTADIITAAHSIYIRNSKEMGNLQRPIVAFTPTKESESSTSLIMRSPTDFYEFNKKTNKHPSKPILIGYNTQESISEVIPFIHNPYYLSTFIKNFKFLVPFADGCSYNVTTNIYRKISGIIKDKYFKSNNENSLQNFLKYTSDLLKYPIIKFIQTHLNLADNKLYMYKFDYRGPLNAVKASALADTKVTINGAASGDEICYLFKCEPFSDSYRLILKDEANKDVKFINNLTLLWTNFIKYGNPTPHNSDVNVTWLTVDSNLKNFLLIRKYFQLVSNNDDNDMFNFWNHLYMSYYSKEMCNKNHDEL